MRRKKHREERMEKCADIMLQQPFPKGEMKKVFGNENPIHMEIGCGKGGFVTTLAEQNPDINYLAIEKNGDVLVLAMEKAKSMGIKNVKFIFGDATFIEDIVSPGEISRIYINFCDPWHKSGHAKRRLTHRNYLETYKRLLCDNNGEVFFKTDNRKLFEFSLNECADLGLKMSNISLDLHNSNYVGNIMTEYEKLFSEQGLPIYRLEIRY
ncbi:MAG: tRNA (guanosine(46)-N7)-methyltransferase TrmB [Monoglobales bacterium]